MLETIRLLGIGIALGIANVIPGVSGGTIAVVFGIYDRLLRVITIKVRTILSEWKFLLPLGIGILGGIFLSSVFISFLFARFPTQTYWFFIGIILGSIPMLYVRMVLPPGAKLCGGPLLPAASSALSCLSALFVMVAIFFVQKKMGADAGGAERTISVGLAAKMFFGLALAAAAMIIPGISGSFLMVVIGVYETIVTAVAERNIPLLAPGALGAAAGLLGGAMLVRFLLLRVPNQTYGAILGLVLGSVCVLLRGFGSMAEAAVSILCAAAGFAVSFAASRK